MSPKNGTTVDLTVPSSSDPMSVNNTDNELVSTIETIDTDILEQAITYLVRTVEITG